MHAFFSPGLLNDPLFVELWLTLARLETPENAKVVLNKVRRKVLSSHEI